MRLTKAVHITLFCPVWLTLTAHPPFNLLLLMYVCVCTRARAIVPDCVCVC